MRTTSVCALSVLFLLNGLLAGDARATLLSPGDLNLSVPNEPDPVGGTTVATLGPLPFTAATFSGTLTSNVISGDTSNPWGGLTFTYSITNSDASLDAIARLSVSSFDNFLTDVSFKLGYNETAPALANRSANGRVVGFDFLAPSLIQGGRSALLVVQTDATQYAAGIAGVINGSVVEVATLAPIPEPATLALLATGLAGFARRRARRPNTR